MSIFIRSLESEDKEIWSDLWQGYLTFYEADISDEQSELTWQRLLDPHYNSFGLVAELDGQLVGITHYSFQTSTWAETGYCYLEDLFTNPEFRGKGVGRALIEAVKEVAISNRCSRVYWNTDESNSTARALYDTFSPVSGKRQYRIKL
jgi:GNAT superfamily N-acetyltransferase